MGPFIRPFWDLKGLINGVRSGKTSNFTTDLQADSLDVVELVMTFEEEFDVLIQDEDAGDMSTVQDAIDYIVKLQES